MTTNIGTPTHTTALNKSQQRKKDDARRRAEEAAWQAKNGPVIRRQMTPEERAKYGVPAR
jgi:hypothetical protein